MEELVPTEDRIEWSVRRLRSNRSGGPSGTRLEHLRGWLRETRKAEAAAEAATGEMEGGTEKVVDTEAEKDMEATETKDMATTEMYHWKKVVELVKVALQERRIAEEDTWQAVLMIPKGGWDYQGIFPVEVVWKVVTVIRNCRFNASTAFHNVLHGFREGQGKGTASLETKLFNKLKAMREEVLYVIFLELHKAYAALDRDTCLEILEEYGVGPWSGCIL